MTPDSPRMTTTRRIVIVFSIATALVLASAFVLASRSEGATKVVRVIDGDTLVLDIDGKHERVRILSIDTPETKDRNQAVECLGEEAAAFVKDLLPVGAEVELRYDVERRDRYGRLLAAVITVGGHSVAEELAAKGLGVPIQVGANSAYFDGVRSALAEAETAQRGFFDPSKKCTLPAQHVATMQTLTAAATVPAASTSAEASSRIAQLVTALAGGKALMATLKGSANSLAAAVIPTAHIDRMIIELQRPLARAEARHLRLLERRTQLEVELRRAEEERRREAEERRRATEERERLEAAAAAAAAGDDDDPSDGGSGNGGDPYPGYTGPRCYEPGGVVWKPC